MSRIVLHPVHRFILKIVFKRKGRACEVFGARAVFLCVLAALRAKKRSRKGAETQRGVFWVLCFLVRNRI